MDPQRLEQVDKIFRAAAARSADDRDSLLSESCAGNPELRRAVETMLRQEDADATKTLVGPGQSVGPYEILGPLGAGGMGEVFRARDTRLGRPVAVKFLSSATAADRAALERFRREAQAISALNHPNVCTIYDIGEQDGRPYLVMELLDGQTLKQRIASGPFSNDQILSAAISILEALEAAHAAAIVHRDIKPANIFLTKPGTVKILDFGLAKTAGPAGNSADESLTVPGTTLGTASYMSPEQARGEAIDARADLFSCGVVLYEMATGKKPFDGGNWVGTLEAVMNRTPQPARELNRDLLPEIEHVIDRALEKDPSARYQTAADMRADLVRIKLPLDPQRTPARRPARRSMLRYVAAAVPTLLAIAGLAWYFRSPKGPVTSPSEYVQLTNFSDYATAPALSPDGRMVAFFRGGSIFLGTGQIYVKLLPDGESKVLTDDPNPKYDPVFTPDGSRVAYTVQSPESRTFDTFTAPVLGGAPTRLMPNAAGLSWFGPDHRILFSEVMSGTALHMGIVTSQESRAEEREIYFPNHERAMAHYSWPSPDLKSLLIAEMDRTASFQRCRVVPMDGRSTGAQVGPEGACIASAWSPDGRWMYFNVDVDGSTHLWRQQVPDGIPQQITFGPTEEEGLAMAPDGKWLVSSIGVRQSSVWTHDASGDHAVSVEGSVHFPRLSPDGKRLYYLLRKGNSSNVSELWSRELISGKSDPIVTGLRVVDYDILEDQSQVAFTVRSQNTSQIYLAALDRSSPPRLVTKDGDTVNFAGNGVLLFRQLGDKSNYLARIRTDGNGLERITDTPIANKETISPDGEWATVSGSIDPTVPTGTNVISLRDHSRRNICSQLCSVGWSRDGKFLYVTTNRSLFVSTGRTLVFPMPRGFGQAQLPAAGFDRATDEELARLRVIPRGDVSPGPDPDTYAFTMAAFQGNLFRIPLH